MGFLGLFTRHKPKIKVESTKKDGFSGWVKCTKCEEMIHANELQENHNCCPKCGHHYRLSATQRVELLADPETFQELYFEITPSDPLNFIDSEAYTERLAKAANKTGRNEAVMTGTCRVGGIECALGILDFGFMGGVHGISCGREDYLTY